MRADAVSLEVPIKVHGSLVPNLSVALPTGGAQAQPFEEQTSTMIVFPQGGVLKMSTAVSAGQAMVLTNLKSRQEAICRVVKVRAYGNTQSYVEIEFTSAQPGYWGVYFPTDSPEVARLAQQQPSAAPPASLQSPPVPPPASSAPQHPAPAAERKLPEVVPARVQPATPAVKLPDQLSTSAEVRHAPLAPPRTPAPAKLPESSFASIGTKEEVLAPADATREPRASSFPDRSAKSTMDKDHDVSDAIDALIVTSAKPAAVPRVEQHETNAATFASKAFEPLGSAAEARPRTPKQMFGVTLDSAIHAEKPSRERGSKLWIPVGIAAVAVLAAAGAYYFHFWPSANKSVSTPATPAVVTAAAPPSNPQPVTPQPVDQNAAAPQVTPDQSAALQSPDVSAAEDASRDRESAPSFDAVGSSRERRSADTRQAVAAKTQPQVAIPSTFGTLNTRPILSRDTVPASAGTAPALNGSAVPIEPTGSLPAIAPPPVSAPVVSKPVSNAPVRVGGRILPPRLVSSVLPIYPEIAQQARVSGTVVIDATIDKAGNVAKMRVISGPELLRDAALSALRRWKYEPSKLNGQPISVEMVVSIQFH